MSNWCNERTRVNPILQEIRIVWLHVRPKRSVEEYRRSREKDEALVVWPCKCVLTIVTEIGHRYDAGWRKGKKSNRASHFPSRSPWKVSRTVYAQWRRLPAPGVNARSSSFKAATFDFLDYAVSRYCALNAHVNHSSSTLILK